MWWALGRQLISIVAVFNLVYFGLSTFPNNPAVAMLSLISMIALLGSLLASLLIASK